MDLLRYSDTVLHICLRDKTRREIHDVVRQVFVVPQRIRICPCVTDPWVRKTLEFLGAVYDNEPSHRPDGSAAHRELPVGTEESAGGADESTV